MKKEIELAKQAGWEYADDDRGFAPLWRFAELIRADEREACAKVCEEQEELRGHTPFDCAAAIRARSNT